MNNGKVKRQGRQTVDSQALRAFAAQRLAEHYGARPVAVMKDRLEFWQFGTQRVLPRTDANSFALSAWTGFSPGQIRKILEANAQIVFISRDPACLQAFRVFYIDPRTIQAVYGDAHIPVRDGGCWLVKVRPEAEALVFQRCGAPEVRVSFDSSNWAERYEMTHQEFDLLQGKVPAVAESPRNPDLQGRTEDVATAFELLIDALEQQKQASQTRLAGMINASFQAAPAFDESRIAGDLEALIGRLVQERNAWAGIQESPADYLATSMVRKCA